MTGVGKAVAIAFAKEGAKLVISYLNEEADAEDTKLQIEKYSANLAFTQSIKGIRINGVAPGSIWTPLIPASFSPDMLANFGKDTPLKRLGQPYEVAPTYVYLASNIDSSYVTGQVIHVNGGIPVGS